MSSDIKTVLRLPGIEDWETREAASPAANDTSAPSSLVGEVLDNSSSDFPGRTLVRWRAPDGTLHERWLVTVRRLALQRGDMVLLHQPGNWPEWLVTHAFDASTDAPESCETELRTTDKGHVDVVVDDKRIEIEGQDEVVLRCGKASITLRRNGRVVIRGTYVESRSSGTNRIKGGSVLIN